MKQNIIKIIRKAGLLNFAEQLRFMYLKKTLKKANGVFKQENPGFVLPPAHLAYDAYSAPDWNYYKKSGEEVSDFLADVFSQYVKDDGGKKKLLEWGCGPGRIIRHLPSKLGADVEVYGTDYNEETIKWCQKNIPDVHFKLNWLNPPLAFPPDFFDFVYCFSVFTHLSEDVCKNWMVELRRVLKPDSILVFSTHGDSFREKILTGSERNAYDNTGIVVRSKVKEGSRAYATIHSPDYIKKELLNGFKLLEFKKDGFPGSMQDLWIVQKLD